MTLTPMALTRAQVRRAWLRKTVREWAYGLLCFAVLVGMAAVILGVLFLLVGSGYTMLNAAA